MRVLAAGLASVLAACAGFSDSAVGPPADAPGAPCMLAVTFDPPLPVAQPTVTVRISAVGASGVPSYHWQISRDGVPLAYTAGPTGAQVDVTAGPGVLAASVAAANAVPACEDAHAAINVRAAGARVSSQRLRVVAPSAIGAPVFEKRIPIYGGASATVGAVAVDTGFLATLQVSGPGGGVPAYVKFASPATPDAFVDAYADATGRLMAQLPFASLAVTVQPSAAAAATTAPRALSWTPGSGALTLDGGRLVTGSVVDPAGVAIAGAAVQLTLDGLASAPAITAANGSFAARVPSVGTALSIEVAPPAALGLPRLAATSSAFDLGAPLQVQYAAALVRRNLAGARVLRGGAPVAGARVTLVATGLTGVGAVVAGTSVAATGEVRFAATADAAGRLAAAQVPAAALSAVVAVAADDLAVAAFDTTTAVPPTIDAPPMIGVATTLVGPGAAPLEGAVLELVPVGALALAAAPPRRLVAGPAGAVSAALASGGHYDLRASDPAGRAASIVVADRVAAGVAGSYPLAAAVSLSGVVLLDGGRPIQGASVQLRCDACSGTERDRPIAETLTNAQGEFVLAVPDPGTLPLAGRGLTVGRARNR